MCVIRRMLCAALSEIICNLVIILQFMFCFSFTLLASKIKDFEENKYCVQFVFFSSAQATDFSCHDRKDLRSIFEACCGRKVQTDAHYSLVLLQTSVIPLHCTAIHNAGKFKNAN